MATMRRLSDGRWFLVGGKFLLVETSSGNNPPVVGTPLTSLTVRDYYTAHPEAEPTYQRKAGFDYIDMPVMFDFVGDSAANVQARVVKKSNGAEVRGWANLIDVSQKDNGAGKIGLGLLTSVPIGAGYIIQTRDSANPTVISSGTQAWGVGVVWGCFGQSNMVGTLTSYAGAIVPNTGRNELGYYWDKNYPTAFFTLNGFSGADMPDGWSKATAGAGACQFLRIVAKTLEAKYGRKIPVCMIPWCIGGTGIDTYYAETGSLFYGDEVPGGIGMTSDRNYAPGDFEGFSFHQGENDVAVGRGPRVETLKTLYQGMLNRVARYGRTAANLTFLHGVLGVSNAFPGMENIRAAAYDLAVYAQANNWPRVRTSWSCIDLDPDIGSDGMHFKDTDASHRFQTMSAMRMIHDVCHVLAPEIVPNNAQGPKLAGTASRNGLVVTLPILKTPNTLLAVKGAGAITGINVNTARYFEGSDVTSFTSALVGDNLVLTFQPGTVFPLFIKNCGGKIATPNSDHPDVSNLIYDDMPYPTGCTGTDLFVGLPLQPSVDSIEVT